MEMDLSKHVIIPREDFIELQTEAWNQSPMSTQERLGAATQTALVLAAVAGAVTAGSWGWAKAMDWREERSFQRRIRSGEVHVKAV